MAKGSDKGRSEVVVRRGGHGALHLSTEEEKRVRASAKHVAGLIRRGLLSVTVQVGDYLVKEFHKGSLELARSTSPVKPLSFERLLDLLDSESDIGASVVRRAIAISVQYWELPASLRDRLSLSLHQALLPVAELEDKIRLGEEAVAKKLAKHQLERLVRSTTERHAGGRPPQTEVEKASAGARRLLASATIDSELTVAQMRRLSPAAREKIVRDLHEVRERSERITDLLQRVR